MLSQLYAVRLFVVGLNCRVAGAASTVPNTRLLVGSTTLKPAGPRTQLPNFCEPFRLLGITQSSNSLCNGRIKLN